MLRQCDNCEFYNQTDAPFCLDCGKRGFAQKYQPEKGRNFSFRQTFVLTVVLTAIITAFRYFLLPPGKFDDLQSYFVFTIVAAFVASAIFAQTILSFFSGDETAPDKPRKLIRSTNGEMTLCFIEDEIADKVRILNEEHNELLALFQPFDEDDNIEFVETNKTDEKLAELVEAKLALHSIQYKEVCLIRVENDVLYYHENLQNLDENELEDGEVIVEGSLAELEDWAETPELPEQNSYFDIFDEMDEKFVERIERTQKFCETVRGELAVKRDSIGRGTKSLPQQTSPEKFADFKIERILTDYQTAFDILEIEYDRLKSENTNGDESFG